MDKALQIQKQVQEILGTEEVFLVGGSVRDLVMNNTPKDYDFTTSMLPEDIIEKVKAAGRRVYTIGEKFGTIGFKVPVSSTQVFGVADEGTATEVTHIATQFEYVEVTTFRSEVYTNKSRKPEVRFVPSLDEDLARRDFTMNAMVLRSDGTIYDPYGGKLDIYAKQIKTVGLPKDRIIEDPLRIFRAARFAARYNFTIDPNFIGKARQLSERIFDVSVERWVQEMDKLLVSEHVSVGIQALKNMNIMQLILPEVHFNLWPLGGVANADEGWQSLLIDIDGAFADEVRNNSVSSAPHAAKKYIRSGICARFKFSNDRTDKILDKHKNKE